MSYLFTRLPPFAADYSGFASALHDLGGLVVIHDASGCTGSYTGYDEPRWFSGTAGVFCSGLRELDAIMGNDERLLENILRANESGNYHFIAIIGSPVPMLVGFDYEGFANLVSHETGLPAFGFPATGLALYEKGLSAAFMEILERFVTGPDGKARSGANILGASPLDNFDTAAVTLLTAFLERSGFSLVSVWGQQSGLQAIARAAQAEVNLVVSAAALPLARAMQARWNIPYVTGLPLDAHSEEDLRQRLLRSADGTAFGDATKAPVSASSSRPESRMLLIGEQVRMNAIREALRRWHPHLLVQVGSFFAWEASLAEAGDRFFANEEEAMRWVADEDASLLAGDPLLKQLLPKETAMAFMPDPHLGISGRLCRHSVASHFGREGEKFLENILEGR